MEAVRKPQSAAAEAVAQDFVSARLKALAVPDFPGVLPTDLEAAYAVQDVAISIFPDDVAGWKIGKVAPEMVASIGSKSISGPVFRKDVHYAAPGGTVEYGMFVGGFAAVEAEYMFEIGEDAPVGKTSWSTADAVAVVKRMICGVEMAGSPLATINKIGPYCVFSDFGNNNGIIVGPEISNWRDRVLSELTCETFINGRLVGTGMAASVPGGPLESLRFVAEVCAHWGRPLKAGQFVTTGAITGIHDVTPGEVARVEFNGLGAVQCVAVPRTVRV